MISTNARAARPRRFSEVLRTIGLGVALSLPASIAQADGNYFQLDVARSTSSATASLGRGPFTFGAGAVRYDGGRTYGLSATWQLPLDTSVATIKVGPALGLTRDESSDESPELGLKVVAERYIPTDFGSVFLLADLNSIDSSWFVLAQFGLAAPDLAVELSHGESDTYSETSVALSRRLQDGPVSLRLGYRLESKEAFAGISINTF